MNADLEIPRTLLITLTGRDRPGVTSRVFGTLASYGVEVVDIEQIVLRRRLILGVLVTAPREWKRLRDALEQVAADLDMQVEVDKGTGDNRSRPEGRRTRRRVGQGAAPTGRRAPFAQRERPGRACGTRRRTEGARPDDREV